MAPLEIIRIDKTQGHLVFELFDKYRVFYRRNSDPELARRFIQERLDHRESVIFAALAGSPAIPVGFTQLYPKYSSASATRNWILNDLYVEEEYRRTGIGRQLIQTALSFAKDHGADFVTISTEVDNFTAQRLYEQIGFLRSEPETDFYNYRINV